MRNSLQFLMISKPSDPSNIKGMKVLIVEPFYGGSHKQLIDYLKTLFEDFELVVLPAKKWHWRARTSALYLSQEIPRTCADNDILFCSSVLNLSELLSLRPDLARIPKKIVYFHENQLIYPVREVKNRDFQYGYNQILTALVADIVLFNSQFNLSSFLENIGSFLKVQPDCRPDASAIKEGILKKSQVLHFPIQLPKFREESAQSQFRPLHIVWPHRWEHDKNPEAFFEALYKLKETGEKFQVSVLGETFEEVPDIFHEAQTILKEEILHFGWVASKEEYVQILCKADVAVSTANHEFFGVAMLEAASAGCLPLVPSRLVYPEIYPQDPCIYRTDQQLFKKLRALCQRPHLASQQWTKMLSSEVCDKFSADAMKPLFMRVFQSK